MSATADSARFSSYFNDAPCIEIPGTTFPVEDIYLEDIVQFTRYKSSNSIKSSRKWSNEENDNIKSSLIRKGINDESLISTIGMLIRSEKMDYDLIAATVEYIHDQYDHDEAVLVFVTGKSSLFATTLGRVLMLSCISYVQVSLKLLKQSELSNVYPLQDQ